MTRKLGNILAAILLTLGLGAIVVPLLMALPWVLFPLKDYPPLRYPDGVTFFQDSSGRFRKAGWSADDWDHPTPCPLTVHLPTGDLDPAHLASLDRLGRDGWTEEPRGLGIDVFVPGRLVECHFRNRALAYVNIDSDRGLGPVAVSYRHHRIDLPATAETITGVLGPPEK